MTAVGMNLWRTQLHLDVRAEVDPQVLSALLRQRVAQVDRAASRFRADSEVSHLQRCAGEWVRVSPLLRELLHVAVGAARATDGIVHPGLGAAVAAAGYDEWAGMPGRPAAAPAVLPWQAVEFDGEGAVRIPPGMVLDLGATAKAWLADSLAGTVFDATGAAVLANMGGDIRAIAADEPWAVWLEPQRSGVAPVELAVRDAGVATSGVAKRRWEGGHHIIDPRTGAPAQECWWSASVVAADAVGANAAATASVVLGPQAVPWLQQQGLVAWLVGGGGTATRIGWRDAA